MASGGYKATYERLQSEVGSLSLTGPRRANTRGAEENTRRIVLLGKTGSGKSSLANTMFGEENTFTSCSSANSGTKECMSRTTTINGRSIQLIDTPGLFDTDLNSDKLKSEILRCIVECAPGPHAFLLVLKVERYTKHEQEIVDQIKEYFGEEALKYTTVVFTHGDQLDKGTKIEYWFKDNKSLKNLVDKCKGGCFVVDNKYWNDQYVSIRNEYRNNQNQIEQLLETIDQTVRDNGGKYYINKMLQEVQEEIIKEKKELTQSSPNISKETLHRKAKKKVYSRLKKTLCVIGGTLLGFFLGAAGAAGAAILAPVAATATVVVGLGAAGSVIGGALGGVGGAKVSKMKHIENKADEDVNDEVKKQK